MRFAPENIPQELKEKRQWVNWDFEIRDSKQTKVPKQPNGRYADSTDPMTWSDFDACLFCGYGELCETKEVEE